MIGSFQLLIIIQVYTRLQKLRLCLSHKATLSFIETLGIDFDKDVISWKNDIEARKLKVRVHVDATCMLLIIIIIVYRSTNLVSLIILILALLRRLLEMFHLLFKSSKALKQWQVFYQLKQQLHI